MKEKCPKNDTNLSVTGIQCLVCWQKQLHFVDIGTCIWCQGSTSFQVYLEPKVHSYVGVRVQNRRLQAKMCHAEIYCIWKKASMISSKWDTVAQLGRHHTCNQVVHDSNNTAYISKLVLSHTVGKFYINLNLLLNVFIFLDLFYNYMFYVYIHIPMGLSHIYIALYKCC